MVMCVPSSVADCVKLSLCNASRIRSTEWWRIALESVRTAVASEALDLVNVESVIARKAEILVRAHR